MDRHSGNVRTLLEQDSEFLTSLQLVLCGGNCYVSMIRAVCWKANFCLY